MSSEKPFKVLIVDDEEVFTNRLARSLRKNNYDIHIANCGNEALKKFRLDPAEIMVTDVKMPGIDGLELTRKVLDLYPETVVIVITGHGGIETAVESIKVGAIDFLQKPLSLEKITSSLKKAEAIVQIIRNGDSDESKSEINLNYTDDTQLMGRKEFDSDFGEYKIVKLIGEGAHGTVYLAEKDDRQLYALKTLRLDLRDESESEIMIRFENEATAISKMKHPNIIDFKEIAYEGPEDMRLPYIVMEYFEGQSLDELLEKENTLSIDDKVCIISQIASALECVHDSDIYHRDIKPANILVSDDLIVKIADFGICHMPQSDLTHHSKVLGTPYYLAPESMKTVKKGHLLDIYALGVVAYEMFLGIKPFIDYDYNRLMYKVINEYPIEPKKVDPDFPEALQKIIGKMLQKKPEYRYQSAREVVDALVKFSKKTDEESLLVRMKDLFFSHKVWE